MVGLEGHYKSQGLGVPVRPISPFSDPSRNLSASSSSDAVFVATPKHGPNYPCVLICDRNRSSVMAAPLSKFVDPCAASISLSSRCPNDSTSSVNQEGSEVLASTFADAHHHAPIPARMLARHESKPSCQMSPIFEVASITNGGDHCCCGFGADAADPGNPLASLAGFKDRIDLLVEDADAVVDLQHKVVETANDLAHQIR